jgi:hypothetical protein
LGHSELNEIICCLDNLSEYEKKYYENFGNIYFLIRELKEVPAKENGEWSAFTPEKLNEIKLRIC